MITLHMRKKLDKTYSIEKIFSQLHQYLENKNIQVRYLINEYPSFGVVPRMKAGLYSRRNAGRINHVTGDNTFVALFLPRDGLVVTFHDLGILDTRNFLKRLIFSFLWFYLPARRAQKITFISDYVANDFIDKFGPGFIEKSVIIPNPVGDDLTESAKLQPGLKGDRLSFLMIGTKPNKNIDRVIEALIGVHCNLTVIGRLAPRTAEKIQQQGLEVENFFDISDEELREKYLQADCLIFPSTFEGFGVPIIEAQRLAIPVITSFIEPMVSVCGGAAILVDPFSPQSIRNGVNSFIHLSPSEKEIMIEAGLRNSEKYTVQKIAATYLDLYRSIRTN